MLIERLKGSPIHLGSEKYDCIWISLPKEIKGPISNPLFQWIDWKLNGQMARILRKTTSSGPFFIPTVGKLPTPYVVIELGEHWELFTKNCEGMKFQRLLMFSYGMDVECVQNLKDLAFPNTVYLAVDH